jgi:hypothetical protein
MLTFAEVDARLDEVGWIPGHLDDLDADFRAFYGEPDMLALPGPRFFALAERTFAYGGVMTARAEALRAVGRQQSGHSVTSVSTAPVPGRQQPADAVTLAKDSRFAGIFSVARVPHA